VSRGAQARFMDDPRPADLASEAERYLAVVELFRAAGCEPHWRPEPGTRRAQGAKAGLLVSRAKP
jgi:hypothetical protein